jgi:Ras-related protein Rab-11A
LKKISEDLKSPQMQDKIKDKEQKYIELAEDLKAIRDIIKSEHYLEDLDSPISRSGNLIKEHRGGSIALFNKIKMSNKKVILAGDGGVGKLTFLIRLTTGKFSSDTKMTIGVECLTKSVVVNDKKVNFCFWTLGGQERFRSFLALLCRGANAAILIFNLTRTVTLDNIEQWVNICRKKDPNLPILFLGSKADLIEDICIKEDYILEMREAFNLYDYLPIPSKTGENVSEAFEMTVRKILEQQIY